jgi:hypothetical protein
MRLYELEEGLELTEWVSPKELTPGATATVHNVRYKYDANRGWLLPNGKQAAGIAKVELMRQYGRDPSGNPIQPGLLGQLGKKLGLGRIADKIAPFGQGIDPNASALGKGMGVVGSMLGRGAAYLTSPRNKQAGQAQAGQAQAGQAQAGQAQAGQAQAGQAQSSTAKSTPQAPKPGAGDTRQSAVQVDQDLGNIVRQMRAYQRAYQPSQGAKQLPNDMKKKIIDDLPKAEYNKDWAVMTGSNILKFANRGYDVSDLPQRWWARYIAGTETTDRSARASSAYQSARVFDPSLPAKPKKPPIMQDIYSENLERLKKLAGI